MFDTENMWCYTLRKTLDSILIEKVKEDAKKEDFKMLYLCTELNGYYEEWDFHYFGERFYDDGERAKIYKIEIVK